MSRAAGTVLAFDFGKRFIGVAVGEHETRSAHPLAMIDAVAAEARFGAIERLVREWRPTLLVVGKPLALDGTPHAMTHAAERFARALAARFRLPVARVDERLTSAEAAINLRAIGRGGRRGKDLTHSVAAQIILQDYFDTLATEAHCP